MVFTFNNFVHILATDAAIFRGEKKIKIKNYAVIEKTYLFGLVLSFQ
jgi:hypothetical protein